MHLTMVRVRTDCVESWRACHLYTWLQARLHWRWRSTASETYEPMPCCHYRSWLDCRCIMGKALGGTQFQYW